MKSVGIITINDNDNYGNRLQNYAVQNVLKKNNVKAITLKNNPTLNLKDKFVLRMLKFILKKKRNSNRDRYKKFNEFNKNIKFSKRYITPFSKLDNEYDYFITGSDQVWNPTWGRLSDIELLEFTIPQKRISFAASFGISSLPEQYNEKLKNALKDYKAISVREYAGKKIIEDVVGRKDVQVLVDPTMLLTAEEWDKVAKKPEQLKTDKYILNYFLGELSEKRKAEIDRIAKENDCEVINILDKNSPFYCTGPSEFLYLENHAFLVCTDSFHSSVFAILYNRPFIVFGREDNTVSMNSRIETLINKFNLKNREYNGKEITKENLNHDYTEAYKILKEERKKSMTFLMNALDVEGIKDNDKK